MSFSPKILYPWLLHDKIRLSGLNLRVFSTNLDHQSPEDDNTTTAPSRRSHSSLDHLVNDDVFSPFFLSDGDHRGLVLVSTILNGTNYQSWKHDITMALAAKNKTAFKMDVSLFQMLVILFLLLGFTVIT
uniref:Retrotransposon Copia-like N-terminal domain-containing protein n=1 Tax=Cannabis sativa TaxID=3483 RepID=A0A803QH02_CANSA